MKNKIVVVAFLTLAIFSLNAQEVKDTSWKKGGVLDLKFTQVALTNWAGGGQNSIAMNAFVQLFANYKKDKISWNNSLDLAYGLFNQAKSPYWAKNDDRIELNSKFGRYAWKHWDYTGFLQFRSQFAPGYKDPLAPDAFKITISDFLAPAYIQFGIGMDYKPNEKFNLLLAPISGKITIVNNQTLADQGAFGVPVDKDASGAFIPGTGKKIRNEFGGTLRMMYKTPLGKNIGFQTRLDLFSNYVNNPQNIDVNWEVSINMKINKYISASINTLLIYDDDIDITQQLDEVDPVTGLNKTKSGPITQFREIFGLGFNYKF